MTGHHDTRSQSCNVLQVITILVLSHAMCSRLRLYMSVAVYIHTCDDDMPWYKLAERLEQQAHDTHSSEEEMYNISCNGYNIEK